MKILKFSLLAIVLALLAIFILAIFASFAIVKPTTENINRNFGERFSKVVRIPAGINPPTQNFNDTVYLWEMETLEKEVTQIKFTHTTGFSKSEDNIQAVLESPPGADVGVFTKVLPSIIVDVQSLEGALDIKRANTAPNKEAGYTKLQYSIKTETEQTIRIAWEFPKNEVGEETRALYNKLYKFPEPLLKGEYFLLLVILDLLGS